MSLPRESSWSSLHLPKAGGDPAGSTSCISKQRVLEIQDWKGRGVLPGSLQVGNLLHRLSQGVWICLFVCLFCASKDKISGLNPRKRGRELPNRWTIIGKVCFLLPTIHPSSILWGRP